MIPFVLEEDSPEAVPLWPVTQAGREAWLAERSPRERSWLAATGFTAKAGTVCLVPDEAGRLAAAAVGLGAGEDLWAWGGLASALPAGATSRAFGSSGWR